MLMRQIGAGKTAEGNEPEDPQPHVPREKEKERAGEVRTFRGFLSVVVVPVPNLSW